MFEKFYKYEKKKRLGRGGMGEVYLAYDTVMKREVALKLVPDDKDSEAQDAIKAERAGAELQDRLVPFSDHVPKVHEYGIQDGSLYIDMEYVEGDDLAKLIFEKQLTYYQIIDIGIQVCEVLQVAHSLNVPISGQPINGIAHGDIKPKNIRINKQGRVKLLDFGIAKALSLTRNLTHSAFGSMEYCSPERLNNGELAPAADLWALGAVLYEAVSGKKAFQASTPKGLENRICSGQPPAALPEHCPKLLSAIIFKALKPDKKERYQSAAEFKADLEQAGQGPTTKISPKETKGK
jgi:serine/threonine protein kinase